MLGRYQSKIPHRSSPFKLIVTYLLAALLPSYVNRDMEVLFCFVCSSGQERKKDGQQIKVVSRRKIRQTDRLSGGLLFLLDGGEDCCYSR